MDERKRLQLINLWLLGMGIRPEQINNDERYLQAINDKDGVAAWDRIEMIRYSKGLTPYPEFETIKAKIEFICFVNGSPLVFKEIP